jgi:hypothetical protein
MVLNLPDGTPLCDSHREEQASHLTGLNAELAEGALRHASAPSDLVR